MHVPRKGGRTREQPQSWGCCGSEDRSGRRKRASNESLGLIPAKDSGVIQQRRRLYEYRPINHHHKTKGARAHRKKKREPWGICPRSLPDASIGSEYQSPRELPEVRSPLLLVLLLERSLTGLVRGLEGLVVSSAKPSRRSVMLRMRPASGAATGRGSGRQGW